MSHRPHQDLIDEQEKTLGQPVMHANPLLRLIYFVLDMLYGREPSLRKFKSLEVLARYPYQAWENSSFHRLTRKYARSRYTDKEESDTLIHIIDLGKRSQDNEQWHMMVIEDIMRQKKIKQGWFRAYVAPRILAFFYLGFTRLIYAVSPKWSFSMNARFESHAEHQYMLMAKEHPEWEDEPVESEYFEYYPKPASFADLFRQIGLDERQHKIEAMSEYERLTGKKLS